MIDKQQEAQAELLRSHLVHNPNDGNAWRDLTRLLVQGPPGEELVHAMEQSIKSLPEDPQVWYLAASVQERIRGQAEALKWLEKTSNENFTLAAPQVVLASLESFGDPEGAIARCERIAAQFSKSNPAAAAHAVSMRADFCRQLGRFQEALSDYRALEKSGANDPQLMNNIGCCLAGLEEFDAASDYFGRALAREPQFTEAKLNQGLLLATRLQEEEALAIFNDVLQDPAINPDTRRTAETIREIMLEHQRLEPFLASAMKSSAIDSLHAALLDSPGHLSRPDQQSLDALRIVADRCRELEFDEQAFTRVASSGNLPFIEAWTQCKIPGGVSEMAEMYARLQEETEPANPSREEQDLRNYLAVIRERKQCQGGELLGEQAEAGLRYWHAQLLAASPQKLPGQFKAIPNTIGQHRLAPPENVTGTVREFLAEIRPSLDSAWSQAIFMYVAITMVHGFADGNGRLSRFFLAAEAEKDGFPPIAIPLDFRAEVAAGMDIAWLEGRLEPLVDSLANAWAETRLLLSELDSRLAASE